jgi:4'-phosphopantetheinyl transferase
MSSPWSPQRAGASPLGVAEPLHGVVDLHAFDLDDPTIDIPALVETLSEDEMARAARFRFDLHRRRFLIGRGQLRCLLAQITGSCPTDLRIITDAYGKPAIPAGPAFNLSHSDRYLLIGVACDGRLGVDIEIRRAVQDAHELARTFFSRDEIAALADVSRDQVSAAFLRVWTRKEALLKAIGLGLSGPLQRFSVEVGEGSENLLLASDLEGADPRHWEIRSAAIRDQIEAAIAWDFPGFKLRLTSSHLTTSA